MRQENKLPKPLLEGPGSIYAGVCLGILPAVLTSFLDAGNDG
jgi:hypothetical protein